MNFQERKNVIFRLISSAMILLTFGFDIFIAIYVFSTKSRNQIMAAVGCILAGLMMIFEIFIILRGWRKENGLYKIIFNPNDKINNVPLIAVSIFALFGVGLIILGTLLNIYRHEEPFITSSFIILLVAVYLIVNTLIYYLYAIMFKKREIKLEDFIK